MISLKISVESDNELLSLWHRLNESECAIQSLVRENGYTYTWDRTHNGCHDAWAKVDALVKQRGIEHLL